MAPILQQKPCRGTDTSSFFLISPLNFQTWEVAHTNLTPETKYLLWYPVRALSLTFFRQHPCPIQEEANTQDRVTPPEGKCFSPFVTAELGAGSAAGCLLPCPRSGDSESRRRSTLGHRQPPGRSLEPGEMPRQVSSAPMLTGPCWPPGLFLVKAEHQVFGFSKLHTNFNQALSS